MLSETKKTLLLVEDEAILALSTKRDLTKYGYNVLVVNTGEKAITICKENSTIDLILMDIDLGRGIDGTKAAELILKGIDIPVVFLSSHTEPEIVDKTEKITSYGYVVKSSSITVLNASIKMAFKLFKAHVDIYVNEEKFSKAFYDHPSPMQIINVKTGERVDINNSYLNLLGFSKEDFQKKNIFSNSIWVDPDKIRIPINILIKNRFINDFPMEIIVETGEIKHLLVSGSMLEIGDGNLAITSFTDISELKRTEGILKISEEKYRRLVENLSDEYFFYTHDTNGIKSYVSPSVTKMLGFTLEEAMSHYGSNLTDNPVNENVNKKTDQAINGLKQKPYLAESFHKDGSKRWLEVSETPVFDKGGKVVAVEGIAHDITERIKAEKEIKHQLQEKETILKEVHHRIKNNFNSIFSLLSLQSQETANPDALSALQDAMGRVNSMQVLYEKLLLSDDYGLTSLKEYLNNLIDDIINLFPDAVNIILEKHITDFKFDPKRLVPVGIIVNELLTNVMKYAFKEKESGLIEITVKEDSGNMILKIKDNGIGLPIGFDLNTQTSFGLLLVKMLSEQLKGKFSIRSTNGTICTLEFSI